MRIIFLLQMSFKLRRVRKLWIDMDATTLIIQGELRRSEGPCVYI
jgi:hypothetical protein